MSHMCGALSKYSITFNSDELAFLTCGACQCVVDAFRENAEQYACQMDHLICNTCAATSAVCRICDTQIERVSAIVDSPTRHPAFYCRRFIHRCPHAGCSFIHINAANIQAHADVSCAYRSNNPPHALAKHQHAFATHDRKYDIRTHRYIPSCTIAFHSPVGLDVELLINFYKHTIMPKYIHTPMYIYCHTSSMRAFYILDPTSPPPLPLHFMFTSPVAEPLTIHMHPIFHPYPQNPDNWPSIEHPHSCSTTVAHWHESVTSDLQTYIRSDMLRPPPTQQLRQPMGVAMPASSAPHIMQLVQFKFESPPHTTVFYMPATATSSDFYFCVVYMPDNTRAHIVCPACAGLFDMQPTGPSSFPQHVQVAAEIIHTRARRVEQLAHPTRVVRVDQLTPCARRLWRSDLAYQLSSPARRAYIDHYPMFETLILRKNTRQSLPVYYGSYLIIDKAPIMVAIAVTTVPPIDATDSESLMTTCALCGHQDVYASIKSIADHFNLSNHFIQNFREFTFTAAYTEYQFKGTHNFATKFKHLL